MARIDRFAPVLATALLPLLVDASAAAVGVGGDKSVIAFLDPIHSRVGLADGMVVQVPQDWPFADFEVGDKVLVTYEMRGGTHYAIRIGLKGDRDPDSLN